MVKRPPRGKGEGGGGGGRSPLSSVETCQRIKVNDNNDIIERRNSRLFTISSLRRLQHVQSPTHTLKCVRSSPDRILSSPVTAK